MLENTSFLHKKVTLLADKHKESYRNLEPLQKKGLLEKCASNYGDLDIKKKQSLSERIKQKYKLMDPINTIFEQNF